MKYSAIAALCLVCFPSHAFERYSVSVDEILKIDPELAAQRSVQKGDHSLLIVPDCFMGMPGYQGTNPPEIPPKILGKSCEELFGLAEDIDIERIKEWARKYNVYIQQHNRSLNKEAQ